MNKIIRINLYTAIIFSIFLFVGCEANNTENNNEMESQSNNILSNSFGFGGHNGTIVIGPVPSNNA